MNFFLDLAKGAPKEDPPARLLFNSEKYQAMDWLQSVVNYKVEQFEHSTLDAFHLDEFYRALPPRL